MSAGSSVTSESVTWASLAAAGVPIPRHAVVNSAQSAVEFFTAGDGQAVVLKGDTDRHKSALGLVQVDLTSAEEVRKSGEDLLSRMRELELPPRLLIQELVPPGPEIFAGVLRDATFGHVVAVGIGGRLIEQINRRELLMPPVSADAARTALERLGISKVASAKATDSAVRIIQALSDMAMSDLSISELDLNPIILSEFGARAVDLRVVHSTADPSHSDCHSTAGVKDAIAHLLSPRTVAVIGASDDPRKPGGRAFRLLGSHAPQVRRVAVNPRGGLVDGCPAVSRVEELPDGVDVAVIATGASSICGTVRELGQRGVPVAVVFASGFQEVGNREGEHDVRLAAAESGVRVCGVNSMGVVGGAPLTFTHALSANPVSGEVSFLTQSGAIGGALLIGAWSQGLGTAHFISVGNETDLLLSDYLDYLANDNQTRVIGVFLEGVRDGFALIRSLRTARRSGRRVVVLHAGTSAVGAASVLSHTGALAGEPDVYRMVLEREGAVVVADISELLGVCQALSWQPAASGPRVGVLSTSGGGCSLVADNLAALGLAVPELDAATQARLRRELPDFAPTRNPIDTTGGIAGDPELLGRLIAPLLESESVDSVLIAVSALIGHAAILIAESIVAAACDAAKPIVVYWMVPEAAAAEAVRELRDQRIPVFTHIQVATSALAALSRPPTPESGVSDE